MQFNHKIQNKSKRFIETLFICSFVLFWCTIHFQVCCAVEKYNSNKRPVQWIKLIKKAKLRWTSNLIVHDLSMQLNHRFYLAMLYINVAVHQTACSTFLSFSVCCRVELRTDNSFLKYKNNTNNHWTFSKRDGKIDRLDKYIYI